MIESLLILVICMAFITFIVAIAEESLVYTMISVILWLFIMINSLYVEIPGTGGETYHELGLSILSLIFIFSGIAYGILAIKSQTIE